MKYVVSLKLFFMTITLQSIIIIGRSFRTHLSDLHVTYGFSYDVCNIRSLHEKVTDEESVGCIRSQAFSEKIRLNYFRSKRQVNRDSEPN